MCRPPNPGSRADGYRKKRGPAAHCRQRSASGNQRSLRTVPQTRGMMLTPTFVIAAVLATSSAPSPSPSAAIPTDAPDALCAEVRKLAAPRMGYSDMDEGVDPLKLKTQPEAVA